MAVIWGLDLKEIQWGKFKSSYMFGNKDYYQRRTRFVVYQLAMILCVVSESLGTAALSNYTDDQSFIEGLDSRAVEFNDDYVGVASFNIFAGVFVATVFGSGFFFDLFWPERREDRGIRMAWKGCAVFASMLILGTVVAETVIVSSRTAYITGVDANRVRELLRDFTGSPLKYSDNGRAVASLVFAWLGFPFVVWSTVLMWNWITHCEKWGPFRTYEEGMRRRKTLPAAEDEETGNGVQMQQQEPAPPASAVLVEQGPTTTQDVPPPPPPQFETTDVPATTHKDEVTQSA